MFVLLERSGDRRASAIKHGMKGPERRPWGRRGVPWGPTWGPTEAQVCPMGPWETQGGGKESGSWTAYGGIISFKISFIRFCLNKNVSKISCCLLKS